MDTKGLSAALSRLHHALSLYIGESWTGSSALGKYKPIMSDHPVHRAVMDAQKFYPFHPATMLPSSGWEKWIKLLDESRDQIPKDDPERRSRSVECRKAADDLLQWVQIQLADAGAKLSGNGAKLADGADLPHVAAFAMLRIEGKTPKEASKIMASVRRKAGKNLICHKAGNHWEYERESWNAVVKLIGKAGGVENYTDPTPEEIQVRKASIRGETAR